MFAGITFQPPISFSAESKYNIAFVISIHPFKFILKHILIVCDNNEEKQPSKCYFYCGKIYSSKIWVKEIKCQALSDSD